MKKNPQLIIGLTALVLYIMSTASSFAVFRVLGQSSGSNPIAVETNEDGDLVIDPGEPKTEVCPLNGQKFTQTERSVWEQRRPLAIMIENSVDSRPQSGISSADIVYEAVAEGGVTRFMAMMYCDAVSEDTTVAPVRSARTHFVEIASEYNRPIYSHVGGANCSADKLPDGGFGPCKSDERVMALEQIRDYGWQLANDVDGMSVGLPVYYRDYQRLGSTRQLATEHTMTTSTQRLWDIAAKRGWTRSDPQGNLWLEGFESWQFVDPTDSPGSTSRISYEFWDGYKQYDVQWNYQADSNTYSRIMGGEPHLDLNTNQPIQVSNVVVQLVDEIGPVDDLKHMYYQVIGEGTGYLFRDGQVLEINWSKPNRTSRTRYLLKNGEEVNMTRGKIWVSIVPSTNTVTYQ